MNMQDFLHVKIKCIHYGEYLPYTKKLNEGGYIKCDYCGKTYSCSEWKKMLKNIE